MARMSCEPNSAPKVSFLCNIHYPFFSPKHTIANVAFVQKFESELNLDFECFFMEKILYINIKSSGKSSTVSYDHIYHAVMIQFQICFNHLSSCNFLLESI